ncbi:MAG: hypothetical protein ER33_09940 [Cyanobium sp. CACIAM 14]|nr:MAG: hypothetical protein ER33_09940 [Cyanobium sp. CACIAM 14]
MPERLLNDTLQRRHRGSQTTVPVQRVDLFRSQQSLRVDEDDPGAQDRLEPIGAAAAPGAIRSGILWIRLRGPGLATYSPAGSAEAGLEPLAGSSPPR